MDGSALYAVRLAQTADIPALRSLIEQSVRVLQQMDYTPAQIDGALGYAFGIDAQLISDQTYFVAYPLATAAEIVACGGWSFRKTLFGSDQIPGREPALLDPACTPAKIRAIFVDPAHARRGLGSLILAHCERAAENSGFRSFEMASTMTGVPLYTLRGYRTLATIDIPLPNGASLPVIHMKKSLPASE